MTPETAVSWHIIYIYIYIYIRTGGGGGGVPLFSETAVDVEHAFFIGGGKTSTHVLLSCIAMVVWP